MTDETIKELEQLCEVLDRDFDLQLARVRAAIEELRSSSPKVEGAENGHDSGSD